MKNTIFSLPFLCAIFYLPIFSFPAEISWHDSQRYGCILLSIYSLLLCIIMPQKKSSINLLMAIFFLSPSISIFLSAHPLWAATEFATFIGLSSFLFSIHRISINHEDKFKKLFFIILLATITLISWKFIIYYLLTIYSHGSLDFWQLISGFNNPRFFGQFFAIAIPILSIPLCFQFKCKPLYFSIISIFSSLAIASGTRGTLLGLLAATAFIFIYSAKRYVFLKNLSLPLIAGFLIHLFSLQIIPQLLGIRIINNSLERLTTHLSARDILWQKSLSIILENPFFGIGPMHFASINSIAAHPHQILLQIATEYGLITLTIISIIFLKVSNKCISTLKNKKSSTTYSFLCGSIISAFGQSMVDGIFVMPYTLICFFICLSFLNIEHKINTGEDMFYFLRKNGFNYINTLIVTFAICILALSLYPPSTISLQSNQHKEIKEYLKPRFWLNGTF